jgi:hypothetical protein
VRLHFFKVLEQGVSMSKCRESNSAMDGCEFRRPPLPQGERASEDRSTLGLPGMKGRMMTRALSG